MIRASDEIYHLIEEILGKVERPLTYLELYDIPEVRLAVDKRWAGRDEEDRRGKFSDFLGFMWRRNTLDRFRAESPDFKSTRRYALWSYAKRGLFQSDPNQNPIGEYKPPKADRIVTRNKGDMKITQKDGELIIELSKFTIIVKPH
jgi:hypothetical protein